TLVIVKPPFEDHKTPSLPLGQGELPTVTGYSRCTQPRDFRKRDAADDVHSINKVPHARAEDEGNLRPQSLCDLDQLREPFGFTHRRPRRARSRAETIFRVESGVAEALDGPGARGLGDQLRAEILTQGARVEHQVVAVNLSWWPVQIGTEIFGAASVAQTNPLAGLIERQTQTLTHVGDAILEGGDQADVKRRLTRKQEACPATDQDHPSLRSKSQAEASETEHRGIILEA